MHKATRSTLVSLVAAAVAAQGGAFAEGLADFQRGTEVVDVADSPAVRFSMEQIEQMVAPVALYPDTLLAQVLMAATYPLEVAQAAQWRRNRPKLEGEALDEALRGLPWDASVKTLVLFPEILDRLAADLAWTQDLGDAFLAQEADVMAAVQDLRRRAEEAGHLASTDQQVVRKTGATIVVEPADPAVVYVPSYNPAVVYGPGFATVTRTTYYPVVYRSYTTTPSWVVFGAGVAVGALLTAVIDWAHDDDYYVIHRSYPRRHHHHLWYHGPSYWSRDWSGPRFGHPGWRDYRPTYLSYGDVHVDRSRTINVERNTVVPNDGLAVRQWQHAPTHRGNVRYRDPKVAERFAKTPGVGLARPSGDRPVGAFGSPERAGRLESVEPRDGLGAPQPSRAEPRWSTGPSRDAPGQAPRRLYGPQAGPSEVGATPPAPQADPQRMHEQARRYQRAVEAPPRAPVDAVPRAESRQSRPSGGWSRPQPAAETMRAPRLEQVPQRAEPRVEPPRTNPFAGRERQQTMPEPVRTLPQQTVPRPQAAPEPSRRQGFQVPERRQQEPRAQRVQPLPSPPAQRAQPPPPPQRVQTAPPPQGGGQVREERRRNPFRNDRNE